MNLKETYNRIAEDWHNDHHEDSWWVGGVSTFTSLLQPGATVLDVGCGSGVKSKYLTEKGFAVTGIDFSENLIAIAKREVPNARFQVLDMREVSTLGQKFEGVFAQASLLHIPKKEIVGVLTNLVSVLEPGGYVYAAVKGRRVDGPEEEVVEENDYGYSYERFFSYYTLDELENYFKSVGLEVVYKNTVPVWKTNWIQIVGKKGA